MTLHEFLTYISSTAKNSNDGPFLCYEIVPPSQGGIISINAGLQSSISSSLQKFFRDIYKLLLEADPGLRGVIFRESSLTICFSPERLKCPVPASIVQQWRKIAPQIGLISIPDCRDVQGAADSAAATPTSAAPAPPSAASPDAEQLEPAATPAP